MESRVAESTQQMLLPGKCIDLYYPDPQTAEKQCYRTSMNSKFQVGFNTLTAGVNVLTIPPNNGVGDVLVQVTITPPAVVANVALAAGWGYALINRLSYRVGGSSQYFLSGAQVLQNALRLCPDGTSRDNIIQLGGPAIASAADWANANNLTAFMWLSLPWSRPSAVSKPPPLPTDLLTQQVQYQLEIFNIQSIAAVNGGAVAGLALSEGKFVVGQVQLQNQGDALARRVDMTTHSLSYPVEFTQQEFEVNLGTGSSGDTRQVSLTGFRSGEVKSIQMWLTAAVDQTGIVNNYNKWYAPQEIVVTYAGDQYARYDNQSSKLWNLINGRMLPVAALAVNQTQAGALINQASQTQWAELPFAQSYVPDSAHSMYVSGKEITNGIVQVSFKLPRAPDAFSGAAAAGIIAGGVIGPTTWTLHVSYVYNSVLVFSQGTADFAF